MGSNERILRSRLKGLANPGFAGSKMCIVSNENTHALRMSCPSGQMQRGLLACVLDIQSRAVPQEHSQGRGFALLCGQNLCVFVCLY